MPRRVTPFGLVIVLVSTFVACGGNVADPFANEPPSFAFTNKSYGHRIAVAVDRDGIGTLALGAPPPPDGMGGMRRYGLGDGKSDPSGLPLENGSTCELGAESIAAGRACLSATTMSAAGLLVDSSGEYTGCFSVGYGRPGFEATRIGPIVSCKTMSFTMAGPDTTHAPKLSAAFQSNSERDIRALRIALATLPRLDGENPPLVLGDEADGRAFFYFKIEAGRAPVAFPRTSTASDRFGAAVAIARTAGSPIILVAAPGAGKIYAYELAAPVRAGEDPGVPIHVGCLADSGATFGEVLATGDLDRDGFDDVLTTAGGVVKVFLGKDRPLGKSAIDCEHVWPASKISFACSEVRGVSQCSGSDFGRSIAVGDFEQNGKPHVAIGAPNATAAGVAGAGAVFFFHPADATIDEVRLGSPHSGPGFGEALASANIGGQDTLFAGARSGITRALWCTGLPDAPSGPRCRK